MDFLLGLVHWIILTDMVRKLHKKEKNIKLTHFLNQHARPAALLSSSPSEHVQQNQRKHAAIHIHHINKAQASEHIPNVNLQHLY